MGPRGILVQSTQDVFDIDNRIVHEFADCDCDTS